MKANKMNLNFNYTSPEFETHFENTRIELTTYAEMQGKHHGLKDQPLNIEMYNVLVVNKIKVAIQELIHYNQQIHQPISDMVTIAKIEKQGTDEISDIEDELIHDDQQLNVFKEQKKQLEKLTTKRWVTQIGFFIILLFGTVEGFFAYDALRGADFSKAIAFMTAIGIAAAVSVGLHVGGGYIRKAENKFQTNWRYVIVLSVALIISCALGYMRTGLYNENIDLQLNTSEITVASNNEISVWTLAAISFILFLVALGFAIKYGRNKEQIKYDDSHDLKCKELNDLQTKVDNKKSRIFEIGNNIIEERRVANRKYEYAIGVENRCINLAEKIQLLYIESNIRFRKDGIIPVFFSTLPKFQFKTFFENINAEI